MAKGVKSDSKEKRPMRRPAISSEAEENQGIALANNLALEQLRNGTASSQIIVHFLKQGSMKERLERERLEKENELLRAKTEALQSEKKVEELYEKALEAMSEYKGVLHGE